MQTLWRRKVKVCVNTSIKDNEMNVKGLQVIISQKLER